MKKNVHEKSEFEERLEAKAAAEIASEQQDAATEAETVEAELEPDVLLKPEDDYAALLAERDQLKDQILRARAEFDNYRKRMARQAEQIRKTAAERLLLALLPVVDNLERALDHAEGAATGLGEGVQMVLRQLSEVLSQQGVDPIPAMGEPFDPNVHEAVMRTHSEQYAEGLVAQEFQRGYRIGDYVLRPSKVVVSAGPPEAAAEETVQESS